MPTLKLNGDQALAYGALTAGVKIVTGYPGSPSSGTLETLIDFAKKNNIYVEWSSNEKVAVEVAIGASIAGQRALVCVKSVGMNAMLDPLMVLNLTPLNSGLVILLGDDPGGYGSQNDQDTRSLILMLEMPMMEPATPKEAYEMMREAFVISEKNSIPVIIRETRSFTKQEEKIEITVDAISGTKKEYLKETLRFVPVPKNVVEKHRDLHQRLDHLSVWSNNSSYNRVFYKNTKRKGIIGAGFAFAKLLDVGGEDNHDVLKLLKLGTLYPLPEKLIVEFLNSCEEVLIVEENKPFIEMQIKAIAHENNCKVKIHGKKNNYFSREGELFRWQIQEAIEKFIPGFIPARNFRREDEKSEIPDRKSFCGGCRYNEVLDLIEEAAEAVKQKIIITGDPGCLVTVAERLDAKYSIGSAVAVADGMSKAGISGRTVALIGDSGFFHTTIPAICNVVHNKSNVLMIVLDNEGALTSGKQPHPGVDRNAFGEEVPKLSIEEISRACGINYIKMISLNDSKEKLKVIIEELLLQNSIAMLILKIPN